jgi:hypothetical protein
MLPFPSAKYDRLTLQFAFALQLMQRTLAQCALEHPCKMLVRCLQHGQRRRQQQRQQQQQQLVTRHAPERFFEVSGFALGFSEPAPAVKADNTRQAARNTAAQHLPAASAPSL